MNPKTRQQFNQKLNKEAKIGGKEKKENFES